MYIALQAEIVLGFEAVRRENFGLNIPYNIFRGELPEIFWLIYFDFINSRKQDALYNIQYITQLPLITR